MTGQAAFDLELAPGPPEEEVVHRLVIPAVSVQKKRGQPIRPPAPEPAPRPRAKVVAGHADVYVPTWARREMQRIRSCWHNAALPTLAEQTPLGIRLQFCFARPRHHFNAAGQVFERFLWVRPIQRGRGDVDNLAKLVLDGLQSYRSEPGAFEADDQVARLIAEKLYIDQAGVLEPQTIVELWAL